VHYHGVPSSQLKLDAHVINAGEATLERKLQPLLIEPKELGKAFPWKHILNGVTGQRINRIVMMMDGGRQTLNIVHVLHLCS